MSDDERDHMFRVAGQGPPSSGRIRAHLPPGVQRLLDRLDEMPVAVYDAKWELLAWNSLFAALHGDPTERPAGERNLAWSHFVGPGTRMKHTPEQEGWFAASLVADLRAATGRYPADEALADLVVRLRDRSTAFAQLWASGVVGGHQSARKTVEHPQVGAVTLDCDVLTVSGSDLRIVTNSAAPGSPDADALALLAVLGTQQLADQT